ncbi:MAG TPA: hypothetical protein VFV13_13540, partial [Acidimicrobiia bacterium]|nr:hypothetical protein [Acidimicrobiia bacterium]
MPRVGTRAAAVLAIGAAQLVATAAVAAEIGVNGSSRRQRAEIFGQRLSAAGGAIGAKGPGWLPVSVDFAL